MSCSVSSMCVHKKESVLVDEIVFFLQHSMCVGLLNLQPREHKGLQVGNGLPGGVLGNEPVVIIVVEIVPLITLIP